MNNIKTSSLFKYLFTGMFMAYSNFIFFISETIKLSFLSWCIPFLASLIFIITRIISIYFPVFIWIPWILYISLYAVRSGNIEAIQRSIIILAPLFVGFAFSSISYNASLLEKFSKYLNYFFYYLTFAALFSMGIIEGGTLSDNSNFATGSITASLLACLYAALYISSGNKKLLFFWIFLALIPALVNTRTGIIAVGLTLPLTLYPWPIKKRLLIALVSIVVGVLVFYTPHIQNKMFFSGSGSILEALQGSYELLTGADITLDDFATSGRSLLSQELHLHLDENLWFGHGANASEAFTFEIGGIGHPHNDWLRLRFDYGLIGAVLYGLTIFLQLLHAQYKANKISSKYSIYLYVGASGFIPMIIFMFSDNILLYAGYFGNLHFAFLGIGYSIYNSEKLLLNNK